MGIEGTDRLRQLAQRLRDADKTIRRELTTQLRQAVKPVTREVQDTVRSGSSHSTSRGKGAARERAAHTLSRSRAKNTARKAATAEKNSGLRQSIARATGASVSGAKDSGVNAVWRVRASKMPKSQAKLPKYWNKGSWRHPVFGNRNKWVTQTGAPFFDRVISAHREDLQKSVVAAMEQTAQKVTEQT